MVDPPFDFGNIYQIDPMAENCQCTCACLPSWAKAYITEREYAVDTFDLKLRRTVGPSERAAE